MSSKEEVRTKFNQLAWLAYQATSELSDYVESEEFTSIVHNDSHTYIYLHIGVIESRNKLMEIQKNFDLEVNIVETAKKRLLNDRE